MRAVPFFEHGPVQVLQYREDFPDPVLPKGKAVVLVDVKYCGLNHLDIWTRQGLPGKKIRLPHVCGCDIVGTVKKQPAATGNKGGGAGDNDNSSPAAGRQRVMVYPGVSCGKCLHCKSGRENLCSQFAIIGGLSDYDGGYAEKVAVPAANVVRLPDSISDETAATLGVSYLTAWNMLRTNGAGRGSSLFVYGAASGVGMATIQLAKALGASPVITTASSREKAVFARKLGADHVISRGADKDKVKGEKGAKQPEDAVAAAVAEITSGKGVDVVIDHVGAATWKTSISSLRQGGRMAVCGMTSGNEAAVPVRMFYTKQIVMTGALMGSKAQLLELLQFVASKKIGPVIDSTFALRDAREAQRRMEEGRHAGKMLLRCSAGE